MTRTMTTIIATGTTYAAATGTTVTVNITGTNVADAALPSTLIFAAATPTVEQLVLLVAVTIPTSYHNHNDINRCCYRK